jgi:hypothetical protein
MILDHFRPGGHAAVPFEPAHSISRRSFIRAGVAAGGGLMLSLRLPIAGGEAEAANAEAFAPNAFIRIDGEAIDVSRPRPSGRRESDASA